jgi:hypothetical protein
MFELNKKISERDDTLSDLCPECSTAGLIDRMVSAPLIGYSVAVNGGYGSKVPDGFKDVLKKIHKKAPGSNMDKISSFM